MYTLDTNYLLKHDHSLLTWLSPAVMNKFFYFLKRNNENKSYLCNCAIKEFIPDNHTQINSDIVKIHVTSYMQSNPVNTETEGALESVRWRIKRVSSQTVHNNVVSVKWGLTNCHWRWRIIKREWKLNWQ